MRVWRFTSAPNEPLAGEWQSARVESCEEQITALQGKMAAIRLQMTRNEEEAKAQADAASQTELVDLDAIRAQMATAETNNAKVRANQERSKLGVNLAKLKEQWQALTKMLEDIDANKAGQLASVKFPIDGLSFTDDGVLLNGLPFDQASASQRIKVSAAIGVALNPELRVMLIRDGSLLDDNSMAMLAEIAEKSDTQVWLETVNSNNETAVHIEDGMVARAKEPVTA